MKRDMYVSIAQGKEPPSPQDLGGSVLAVAQLEDEHGQRIPLRCVEHRQVVGSVHEDQGVRVAHHSNQSR